MSPMIGLTIAILVLLAGFVGFVMVLGHFLRKFVQGRQDMRESNTTSADPGGNENQAATQMQNLRSLGSNLNIRFVIIAIIALVMLIPIGNVSSVVRERHALHDEVLQGMASQWGGAQVVSGPVLVIPIVEKTVTDEKVRNSDGSYSTIKKDNYHNRNVALLPSTLSFSAVMDEHYRYRSIYKSLVYEAGVAVDGSFKLPDFSHMSANLHQVRYDSAYLLMGLSDTKAINSISPLSFADTEATFGPGPRLNVGINSGFHAFVKLQGKRQVYPFQFEFNARGSTSLRFAPFGETTEIEISSDWRHPSFQGNVLPTAHSIGDDGFKARWDIPSLARNYPQAWLVENRKFKLHGLLAGVDLYEPVILYSLVNRAVKYGILFIGLTFLTFLILEFAYGTRLHYAQYTLVGLSLALFFLVLLSLSEHVSFLKSYSVASAITVLSISVYTWFGCRKAGQSLAVFLLLAALYVVLYSLLQLEDYALLMGSGLLLVVLLVLMWFTRNLRVETEATHQGGNLPLNRPEAGSTMDQTDSPAR